MVQVKRLSAEQRADLVAYLDGELDEGETQAIEQLLSKSSVARHEVEVLGQTWDLLETLPRETASAEFATNTVARLQTQAKSGPDTEHWARIGALLFGWISVIVSAGLMGYSAGRQWLPRADDAYVDRLPVLENLDDYRNAGNLDFLRELEQSRLPIPSRENTNPPGDRR